MFKDRAMCVCVDTKLAALQMRVELADLQKG